MIPPVLVREEAMYGTGFFPTDRAQVYETVDGDCLVGTSEVPLAAMHMEEFLDEAAFPIRYAGYSTCFRREAGAAGRDTRGILRVHQFDKVEMFSFCAPEQSAAEHLVILSAEEAILQGLGIPYQVVNIAAGDLGAPAAQKFDCEAWLPGQQRYRELTSCSNCTDYQARRLNTRFRTEKGPRFVHTLNGTGVAVGRTLIAIMENYQQADGSHRGAGRPAAAAGQGRHRRLSAVAAPGGRTSAQGRRDPRVAAAPCVDGRLLDRAGQQPLHEVPLEGEEHHQRDRQREERSRRDHVDVGAELAQLREDRHGDRLRVARQRQRDDQVVPGPEELEDRERRDRRPAQRAAPGA